MNTNKCMRKKKKRAENLNNKMPNSEYKWKVQASFPVIPKSAMFRGQVYQR